jgi:DNA polymerase
VTATRLSLFQRHVERWRGGCGNAICEDAHKRCMARGQIPADVFICGEAPGQSESIIGSPFVGPAGKLLDHVVAVTLGTRYRWCMSNLLACLPLGEDGEKVAEPDMTEVVRCAPRLQELFAMCRPRLLVLVGACARDHLDMALPPAIRGAVPWVDITHPAAILRMPQVQQGLAIQRCIVRIRQALEALEGGA